MPQNKKTFATPIFVLILVLITLAFALYFYLKENERLQSQMQLIQEASASKIQRLEKQINSYQAAPYEFLPLAASVQYRGISYDVYLINIQKTHLQLYLNDSFGAPYSSFEAIKNAHEDEYQRMVFAMNAGMYNSDYDAQGLCITDEQEVAPIDLSDSEEFLNFYLKPNGIFLINQNGAQIIKSEEFELYKNTNIKIATQSGPMLVYSDTIHQKFRQGSSNLNIRNGVGTLSSNIVALAISNQPVNFYDFASFFRDRLGCSDALYLDGAISSLYLPELGRKDQGERLGPIFAVFEPKMIQ